MMRLIGGLVVYGMALHGAIQVLERYKGAVTGFPSAGISGDGEAPAASAVASAADEGPDETPTT